MLLEQPCDAFDLSLPSDEGRELDREIRRAGVEGAQLRKLVDEALDVQLVYPHRECQILESARAEIAESHSLRQRLFDESTSRVREEHLAAVTGGGDPRCTVDVDAQVVVSAEDGLAS